MYVTPLPKQKKRKTQKIRNPVPTLNDICEVCGARFAHLHEIFFGEKHRKLSQIYGLTKRLCYTHHNMPYGDNPHFNKEIDDLYKKEAQKRFEEVHGHEEWMRVFGRNYL